MISFEIAGGEAAVRGFVEHLQYFSLAESLGGVESLVCHPASMTHATVPVDRQPEAGIDPAALRQQGPRMLLLCAVAWLVQLAGVIAVGAAQAS